MFAPLFVLFNAIMSVNGLRSPHILPNTAVFDDTIKCMTSTEYYGLTLLAIIPVSAFVSFLIASQLYKRNLLAIIGARFNPSKWESEPEESETETEPEETPEEKYVKLYPIKRASHSPPKYLDELAYSIMVEITPRGAVLMCYNHKFEGFEYWSDAVIPLTMLETVARRYVTEYNCKGFYLPRKKINVVDNEIEPVPEVEPELVPEVEVESVPEAESDSENDAVFLKRKKTVNQIKLEKQIAEEEQVTRFIKKGRLVDFKPKELFKGMNFDEQIVKKSLDYETFKKAMKESMAATTPTRTDYASIRAAADAGIFDTTKVDTPVTKVNDTISVNELGIFDELQQQPLRNWQTSTIEKDTNLKPEEYVKTLERLRKEKDMERDKMYEKEKARREKRDADEPCC